MKRNKILIITIILLIFTSIYSFIRFKDNENDVVHKIIDAKTKSYSNLKELENDSTLIVRGVKTLEEEPTILVDEHGGILAEYTLSKFKIISLEKDETNNDLFLGEEIIVLENEVYNKYENEVHHIAGYTKMISQKEYILFLYYAEENGWYVPCGVTFGKVPIDRNEKLTLSNNTMLESISTDAYKKYIDKQ